MTEKTYKEKFGDWFDEQVANGMKNFKPSFNYERIASQFGGDVIYDDLGLFSHLDFSHTPYITIMHPEIQEYIYEGLYKFVTAPSIRISNATDKWGNVLDVNHPDFMTLDEKIKHVGLCRKTDGISSRFEIPLVLEGIIVPIDGKSLEDYQSQWDAKVLAYEARTGKLWPHPRGE
jgi:hypothetical protein